MSLDFLKNISLQSNAVVKTPIARTKSNTAKTPTNADLRVFRNGGVYPSAALVAACNLQYVGKDAEVKGNGFDIFSSKSFLNTAHLPVPFLYITLVPKDAGKVDLFASTTYNEDGTAKSDVMTQGAVTFGLELLEMIKEVYGVELKEGQAFIDLKIMKDSPSNTDDGIYWIPKTVNRGPKKGEVTLTRRENLDLYPLVPVSMLGEEEAPIETGGVDGSVDVAGNGEVFTLEADEPILDAGEPTLDELEAENDGTVADAAELPAGVLNSDDDDDDTLSV